jgi:hypothetical protein
MLKYMKKNGNKSRVLMQTGSACFADIYKLYNYKAYPFMNSWFYNIPSFGGRALSAPVAELGC